MKTRKDEILDYLRNYNQERFFGREYIDLPLSASEIAMNLHMDRTNVSRLLNEAFREGNLVKTSGKPTYFVSRSFLSTHYTDAFIPAELNSKQDIYDLIVKLNNTKASDTQIQFQSMIGIKENESLNQWLQMFRSSIMYPFSGINILLTGERYTDKEYIARVIVSEYLEYRQMTPDSYRAINCYEHDLESLVDHFDTLLEDTNLNGLLLYNIETLATTNIYRLQFILNRFQRLRTSENRPVFLIATVNDSLPADVFNHLKSVFVNAAHVPPLRERTTKETFEYLLRVFQEEATFVQLPIRVDKEVLNCFLASNYTTNLKSLKNEVKVSTSQAFMRLDDRNPLLTISFDDLSNQLLENIGEVSTMLGEINSIYDYLNVTEFTFNPQGKNPYIDQLMSANRLSNGKIVATIDSESDPKDIFESAMEKVREAASLTLPTNVSNSISEIKKIVEETYAVPSLIGPQYAYGMYLYLNDLIQALKSDRYRNLSVKESRVEIQSETLSLAQSIFDNISWRHKLRKVPNNEIFFLGYYIQLAMNKRNNISPKLLIISHGETIAKNYADYINSLNYRETLYYVDYNKTLQGQSFDTLRDVLSAKIATMNVNQSLLILTDMFPLTSVDELLRETHLDIRIVSPISLPLIISIMEAMQSGYDDINYLADLHTKRMPTTTPNDLSRPQILRDIQSRILDDSIVFLDTVKATDTLYTVLLSISQTLKIQIADMNLAKFIIHCCFSVERVIRQEPIHLKYTERFIAENQHLFNVINSAFSLVNNTFGIIYPQSEIVMICEMFIQNKE